MSEENVYEQSPYQVYLSVHCTECSDKQCVVRESIDSLKQIEAINKQLLISEVDENNIIPFFNMNSNRRIVIHQCALLMNINATRYE